MIWEKGGKLRPVQRGPTKHVSMSLTWDDRLLCSAFEVPGLRFQKPGHEAHPEKEALSRADHWQILSIQIRGVVKQWDFMLSTQRRRFVNSSLCPSN